MLVIAASTNLIISFAVGDKLIKINGHKLSALDSRESLARRIEGVVGSQVGSPTHQCCDHLSILLIFIFSQVSLDFIKTHSDVKYTVTLTRSVLILHSEKESRSPTPNSKIAQSPTPPLLRLPFQASFPNTTSSLIRSPDSPRSLPASPLISSSSVFFEPASSRQASLVPSITESFERKSSTFDRIRADRHSSIDYNSAFRKTQVTNSTVKQTSTSFSFKEMFFPSNIGAATGKH